MSREYLRETEQRTQIETRREVLGIHQNFPQAVDALFTLQYFVDDVEPVGTDRGAVQSFIADGYITAPYTVATIYSLYEAGNYLEAAILLRHLLELIVQMRFLWNHPEKSQRHLLGDGRVPFAQMFDEVSPGSRDYLESGRYSPPNEVARALLSAPTNPLIARRHLPSRRSKT